MQRRRRWRLPVLSSMVVFILIWLLNLTLALRRSVLELTGLGGRVGSRTQRDVSCSDNLEYLYGSICCLNCPAGTYVKSPCTTAGEKGKCEECDYGTHTEHSNGLEQCLKCTKCRSDQEIVRVCSSTQDTECQCKSRSFCDPDQACEVCKKCLRCKEDEVTVRNCTSVSNTVCKKGFPTTVTVSGAVVTVVIAVVVPVAAVVAVLVVCSRRRAGSQSNPPGRLKTGLDYMANGPPEERQNGENQRLNHLHLIPCRQAVRAKPSASMEEERAELWDSLANSASNSQCSLTGLPSPLFPTSSPQPSPVAPRQSNMREDYQLPKLVPVNGEDSLTKCFEYFEEMDVYYHKKFFRYLGINDNLIKSRDHLHHEDRLHELLNVWMEKVGKDASLNNLLEALLILNQRLTAENIMAKAIDSGHYVREKE